MEREDERVVPNDAVGNEPPEYEGNAAAPPIFIEAEDDDRNNDDDDERIPLLPPNDDDHLLNVNPEGGRLRAPDPRNVRSTSLKSSFSTKRQVPKEVRFADTLGLDLTDVRLFQKDFLPEISKSAFKDLKLNLPIIPTARPILKFQFPIPGIHTRFFQTVNRLKVHLENARMFNSTTVEVIARVANLGYEKDVRLMYTRNKWMTTYFTAKGEFIPNSGEIMDSTTDRFRIYLYLPNLTIGERIIFVLRYEVYGRVFWDNNFQRDFVMDCVDEKSIVNKIW